MDAPKAANISFQVLFNHVKGIHKPSKEGEYDEDWINTRASQKEKDKWNSSEKYFMSQGVIRPKVKYPVLFGKGKNTYPGMMATEDIGQNETLVQVPGKLIINTKKAYYCKELNHIFRENP